MKKRNVAVVLWFLAGWEGGGLFVGIVGLPWMLGLVPAIVLAALVLWDPAGIFRPRPRTERRVVEINAYAERLEKRVDNWPAVETHERV
ncbi:MAG: hypothetical protein ABI620_08975 [Chloroflexota bacterium]